MLLLPFYLDAGKFTLEGADNVGIVHKITTALAQSGMSVQKMEAEKDFAPHGGAVLFRMSGIATAAAPLASGFDADAIKEKLEALGDSMNCDVTMEDVVEDDPEGDCAA